jgi:hypothetical protein
MEQPVDIETVNEILNGAGDRKVVFYRRPTGTFYFEEWYFSSEPLEQCWIPLGCDRIGLYASAEIARQEASTSISWLHQSNGTEEERT